MSTISIEAVTLKNGNVVRFPVWNNDSYLDKLMVPRQIERPSMMDRALALLSRVVRLAK